MSVSYTGSEATTRKPACEHCGGSGWVDQPGTSVKRRWRGGVVPYGNNVERCQCLKRVMAKRKTQSLDIPERMLEWRLGNFDPTINPPSAGLALSACQQLVDAWPTSRGLLLHGPPGVGKTRLAVGTLRSITKKRRGTIGLFLPEETLYARLQAAYRQGSTESEGTAIDAIAGVDLLVLDDVGSRRVSDWSHDVIGTLVGSRWNDKKSTIITTNYSGQELLERVGERTLSRLSDMAASIKIEGDDQRGKLGADSNLLDFPEPGSDG